jgi:predicted DNA-binding transcriptional regulator YafY
MAISRSAYRRYKVIDSLLKNTYSPYPNLIAIQEACDEKLGMTPSLDTLEKDIRNMKMTEVLDAPIVYCRTNKGYYYTNPNYSINSIALTENDINSIKETLELLQNIGGGNRVNERFNDAIGKILTTYKEEFPDSDAKRIIIQTDYVEGAKGFENFDILFKACKNQNPVSFSQYSYSKREFKSLIVHPVLLKEFENRWYLVGYSESHNSLRTFGFDRIYEPLRLKRKYRAPNKEEVGLYCNAIYGVYPIINQKKQLIHFKASPVLTNYLEAYKIHASQTGEKYEDGSCLFTLELVPTIELIRLFRSYGNDIKVISPLWIQDKVKN